MNPANCKLIVFDLDGTLVDSAPDIALAVDRMLLSLDLQPCGLEAVKRYVGNGTERLVKRALTGDMEAEPEQVLYELALERFLTLYGELNGQEARLYPGVHSTLSRLQSSAIRLCGITNKKRRFTEPLLQKLGLDVFFEFWVCGDDLQRKKPDPLPLVHVLRRLRVAPAAAWMVGDSATDVATARAAGVRVMAVSYGYNHGKDVRQTQPDCIIDSLAQICTILGLAESQR